MGVIKPQNLCVGGALLLLLLRVAWIDAGMLKVDPVAGRIRGLARSYR
jgi:hypothetical protein